MGKNKTVSMGDFVKITEEMAYSEERFTNGGKLPLCSWIDILFTGNVVDFEMGFEDALIDCESPIEQALAIQMTVMGILLFEYFYAGRIEVTCIDKQAEVEACGNKYRVDFLIPVIYKTKTDTVYKSFIIECDGHDYHEKTKEQVAKNNQRERDLKAAGYEVVRFSGSEIYKSAHKCVEDIMRIIAESYFQLQ